MAKTYILWLHKWLGLIAGAVVFLVSLAGAVYVFQDDLKVLVYPERYLLPEAAHGEAKPLSELIAIAQKQLPEGQKITRVDLYPAKDRTWAFRAVATDPEGFGLNNYFHYYKRVFLNPYTGEVAAVENALREFFQLTVELHMHLLLGRTYGTPIVACNAAVFILMLLSGIVLWWPKNSKRKTLKRRFWFSKEIKRKRLNYDLHQVLGFYSFFFALLIATTGLVYGSTAFKEAYVNFFNTISPSSKTAPKAVSDPAYIPQVYTSNALDNTLAYALKKHPEAHMMSIRLRGEDSPTVDVQVRLQEGRTGDFVWYYVRRADHRIDHIDRSATLTGGDKLLALNYDIHTGNIAGWPTKILNFLIALFCASLPVTGYILYAHKQKGLRKAKRAKY